MLSPEESLELLARLLKEGKLEEAYRLFAENSDENHHNRFSRVIGAISRVLRVGEYVLIFNENIGTVGIVGLDDRYRFFCHPLPISFLGDNLEDITEIVVRNALGFDVHLWEVRELRDGMRIRIQGDVTIRIIRVFDSLESLAIELLRTAIRPRILPFLTLLFSEFGVLMPPSIMNDMTHYLASKISNTTIDGIREQLFAGMLDICEACLRILDNIRVPDSWRVFLRHGRTIVPPRDIPRIVRFAIRNLKKKIRELVNHFACLLENIKCVVEEAIQEIRTVVNHEERYTFVIDRHRMNVIGVYGVEISEMLSGLVNNARRTVLILRPQTISLIHPEHRAIHFYIDKPCIIEIGTLNRGAVFIQTMLLSNISTGLGHTMVIIFGMNPLQLMDWLHNLNERFTGIILRSPSRTIYFTRENTQQKHDNSGSIGIVELVLGILAEWEEETGINRIAYKIVRTLLRREIERILSSITHSRYTVSYGVIFSYNYNVRGHTYSSLRLGAGCFKPEYMRLLRHETKPDNTPQYWQTEACIYDEQYLSIMKP